MTFQDARVRKSGAQGKKVAMTRTIENDEHKVLKILQERGSETGAVEYLVHWSGCREKNATWEPMSNCEGAPLKIKQFEERQKKFQYRLLRLDGCRCAMHLSSTHLDLMQTLHAVVQPSFTIHRQRRSVAC